MGQGIHIRDERRTREELGYVGMGLPLGVFVAWCGEKDTGNAEFHFLDAAHALTSLKYEGGHGPCPGCLRAIGAVINIELAHANGK